jgi:hypothetical protein
VQAALLVAISSIAISLFTVGPMLLDYAYYGHLVLPPGH